MKVAIFGVGLIGGSLARDLRSSGFADEIIGVDESDLNGREALRIGLVDKMEAKDAAIATADLILLAMPVDAIPKELAYVLDRIGEHQVVVDVGSTKVSVVESVKESKRRNRYVPAHPMAGTEYSGPKAALDGLFSGKICILCDSEESDSDAFELVERMFRTIGMKIKQMDSRSHDVHAAYVSHISHISSFVLAATVLEKERDEDAIFEMAGGGFESTVRLAKSSPETWAPIFEQNTTHLLEAIDTYIEKIYHVRNLLNKGKFDELKDFMKQANEIKRIID